MAIMVDRRARDILANALSGFMRGDIRSARFDETVSYYAWCDKTADAGVVAIAQELFSLYDDFRDEPIHVPDDVSETLWRVWVFLRTDLDYAYIQDQNELKAMWDSVRNHWPFATPAEWAAHEHLRPASLPEYDPALIAYRPKSHLRTLAEVLAILAAGICLLAATVAIWLWLHRA